MNHLIIEPQPGVRLLLTKTKSKMLPHVFTTEMFTGPEDFTLYFAPPEFHYLITVKGVNLLPWDSNFINIREPSDYCATVSECLLEMLNHYMFTSKGETYWHLLS
jgi:hypothetical protein